MENNKNIADASQLKQPSDWLAGLKENFSQDLSAGFIVFLLALPLSLGIAKAADVPALMGLVSAIVGGVLITFITGCKLSIKGPAAGLIVIIAGAVADFGGGIEGWKLAAGVMVVAGIVQILFGLLKLGKFVDFFPLAAIHGMLAAIGLIIIAKQVPVMLNDDPLMAKGLGPIELLMEIPHFIQELDPRASLIGVVSLGIMLFWPKINQPLLKKIPAPLLVLFFAIPAQLYFHFDTEEPAYALLEVGNIIDSIALNADFAGVSQAGIFVKYVIMFALVGSLESLLTVKAIDIMDPFKRWSDPNKDLIAIGVGNTLVALLGGIPMISEVARSSANVLNGARTRWSNFFHGLLLLIFAVAAYPLLEMIPNAALAAMLIAVGIKLAHPKEFIHMYKIGKGQIAIFMVTIIVTLLEDLLLGIAAGVLLKLIIHYFRGATPKSLFKAPIELDVQGDNYHLSIFDAAVFSNYLGVKKRIDSIPDGKHVTIEFMNSLKLVDHSFLDNINKFKDDYGQTGGTVNIVGLDQLEPVSNHPLATRKRIPSLSNSK